MTMFRRLIIGLTGIALAVPVTATISHAQRAQLRPDQVSELGRSKIKDAVVRVTGSGADTVEVTTTKSMIAVKLVNGNFNDAETVERENHASAIASAVSEEIVGNADFKTISSLRIEFVKRTPGGVSKILDAIEFRENPAGGFKHHKT
jgi:hypothetical protein